ncbi:hypothetical protein [Bacteroides sp.]|uniref:hypothetical protein n=1 Tax=Bacteroides sp. TaxID=29523 RepID=UPI0026203A91|nr:hypothetical protein [Bacteroides sp.]
MDNIVVITQNVKLSSLVKLRGYLKPGSKTLVVSTQYVFDNETEEIKKILKTDCLFKNFSDILTDEDWENCDKEAYDPISQSDVFKYYDEIKKVKNEKTVLKLLSGNEFENKIIVADDLGIDLNIWINQGFIKINCDYYHVDEVILKSVLQKIKSKICNKVRSFLCYYNMPIYVSHYKGVKCLFYGSMNRISYRLNLNFEPANKLENIKYYFIQHGLIFRNNTIRLSTLHEGYRILPDNPKLNIKLMQDGYLPPNYSSKYLNFFGKYTEFYAWDNAGRQTFLYHNLPNRIIPFRKKIYLPTPNYPKQIRKVLCVASGAGDWTALKNRSDEDKMVYALGKVAALFPQIEFVYRCHPVWIHPQHQGVNSINRVAEYVSFLNLANLKVSSHIPNAVGGNKFCLSFKRSSFENDLEGCDIVFGEHSISMIDAALKNIIFCSVNVTGRRNFFCGITQMGFPHCEGINEIVDFLKRVTTSSFSKEYSHAIENYNVMTDKED